MSSALQTVFEIAGIGTTLLFIALAGLIGLMYTLTSPWLYDRLNPSPPDAPVANSTTETRVHGAVTQVEQAAAAEAARQQRAVALAVAVACGTIDRPILRVVETTSAWQRLHRTRRFSQPRQRARARS